MANEGLRSKAPAALLEAFLSVRGDLPAEMHAGLAALLAARVAEAQAAFPEVQLLPEAFARHLAARLDAQEEPLAALQAVRGPQLWLACACALGDARALSVLEREYLARVPALIGRAEKAAAMADEVTQSVRTFLLTGAPGEPPGISDYSGRGDLLGFLRVIALRTLQKLRRQQARSAPLPADDVMPDLLGAADPERDYLKLRYRGEYESAFQAALAALTPRERLFLRLHYVDGLNIDKIGALYRIHRSTVARRLAEHRRRVLDLTRGQLREKLQLSDSEFDSVLELVRSQLLVSIRSALK